jgi:hypothetical protein
MVLLRLIEATSLFSIGVASLKQPVDVYSLCSLLLEELKGKIGNPELEKLKKFKIFAECIGYLKYILKIEDRAGD